MARVSASVAAYLGHIGSSALDLAADFLSNLLTVTIKVKYSLILALPMIRAQYSVVPGDLAATGRRSTLLYGTR